ncbi:DNA dC-_dU-editing enzyme APOBEC-3G-like isoform X2 [Talpa occidentalis]|uniref:DNA dC->dU-editing enzyme APOBEC-3G-like isoform X2 n=1 Tax=Talpa occidentalis TaxID=50954 RepID=UPI00188EE803|nr:DNA dC->dU-editing enzyme APOBEC-3G-like isoform X2 [Talpa occidentalis]
MPSIRDPAHLLDPHNFFFHFENRLYTNGRKRIYICYEVERQDGGSFVSVASGVLTNQFEPGPQIHPELLFLSWLEQLLSPREHYHVTWFMSWSPCAGCARAVADFLQEHHTVQLSVFAARLYYHWEPEYREGLRRLSHLGAQVDIMSFQHFRYCWDNFVHNWGRRFRPWENLLENYESLVSELESFRHRMDEATFYQTFGNMHRHKETHLCYELELWEGGSWVPLTRNKGFLQNKPSICAGEPVHAELLFLKRILSWMLDRKRHYRVTCYISWSPCVNCAYELAAFLQERSHMHLRVLAARIYSLPGHQDGLRALQQAGAHLAIMKAQDFQHCWETFVDHQGRPFEHWEELEGRSECLSGELLRILQGRRTEAALGSL